MDSGSLDLIPHAANPFDYNFNMISMLKEAWGRSSGANSSRGASKQNRSTKQRHSATELDQQFDNWKDHVSCRGLLHDLTIHSCSELQALGIR